MTTVLYKFTFTINITITNKFTLIILYFNNGHSHYTIRHDIT